MRSNAIYAFSLLAIPLSLTAARGIPAELGEDFCGPNEEVVTQSHGAASGTGSQQVSKSFKSELNQRLTLELMAPLSKASCDSHLGRNSAATSAKGAPPESGEARGHEGWFERVSRTQSEQPPWITPLVTVTPRLEEEFRYDFVHQALPNGSTTTSYGGGKGLELIPTERIEVFVGIPAYIEHEPAVGRNGAGDWPFLVKYRVLSAPETEGNYILTLFLGVSAPTATQGNGTGQTAFSPTVAFGKGWGQFDVQTTLAIGIPTGATNLLGTPVSHNVAFQYRFIKKLWPELEVNTTWWPNGGKAGLKQVFLTPGLVVGRIPLKGRLGLTVGAGAQLAVTNYRAYDHALIFSVRAPF